MNRISPFVQGSLLLVVWSDAHAKFGNHMKSPTVRHEPSADSMREHQINSDFFALIPEPNESGPGLSAR